MPFDRARLESITDRPSRCRNFYCYSTNRYVQDQAIYYLLVRAYQRDPQKRTADFIYDLFINPNTPIPAEFDAAADRGAYLTKLNVSQEKRDQLTQNVTVAVKNVRHFSQKLAAEGGGAGGFFKVLRNKWNNVYKPSAQLFDSTILDIVTMLSNEGMADGGGYQPDGVYQPNGTFARQVLSLKQLLTQTGFDPNSLGIY